MSSLSLRDVILQDLWVHFAAVLAIALGAVDLWYFHSFSRDTELLFIVGGLAGMGLKIVNGSAAALRTAALDTAFTAARTATSASQAAATAAVAAQRAVPPPADSAPPQAVGVTSTDVPPT